MKLYIDPGTGSMLFSILIGLIGAANWILKGWIVKIRFFLKGGKVTKGSDTKLPLVVFADDKRYWSNFSSVCRELCRRKFPVTYYTASPDDPALEYSDEYFKAEFIGAGNKAFAKLNFIKAYMVLSTTPGLDVYQWKRSRDADWYVHILHAASDVTAYRMFGIDYYDAILTSGEYQREDVRELERLRNLPAKELVSIGIPYMDDMLNRLNEAGTSAGDKRTILLAPSWGASSIFNRYGGAVIDKLLETDADIIIRPHPQSFTSETALIDSLMKKYPNSDRIEWNRDADNFEVLRRADILVSDFSGILFEFSLVYDKPVIYSISEFDESPYDVCWLDRGLWTFSSLPLIGEPLDKESLERLPEIIDACLNDPRYAEGRRKATEETWENKGRGAELCADYIIAKYNELTNEG